MEEQHSFADLEKIMVNEEHKESFRTRIKTAGFTAVSGFAVSLAVAVNNVTPEDNNKYLDALADQLQDPIVSSGLLIGCGGALYSGVLAIHRLVQKSCELEADLSEVRDLDNIRSKESLFLKTGKKIMIAAVQAGSFASDVKYSHHLGVAQETNVNKTPLVIQRYTLDHENLDLDMRWRMN